MSRADGDACTGSESFSRVSYISPNDNEWYGICHVCGRRTDLQWNGRVPIHGYKFNELTEGES